MVGGSVNGTTIDLENDRDSLYVVKEIDYSANGWELGKISKGEFVGLGKRIRTDHVDMLKKLSLLETNRFGCFGISTHGVDAYVRSIQMFYEVNPSAEMSRLMGVPEPVQQAEPELDVSSAGKYRKPTREDVERLIPAVNAALEDLGLEPEASVSLDVEIVEPDTCLICFGNADPGAMGGLMVFNYPEQDGGGEDAPLVTKWGVDDPYSPGYNGPTYMGISTPEAAIAEAVEILATKKMKRVLASMENRLAADYSMATREPAASMTR